MVAPLEIVAPLEMVAPLEIVAPELLNGSSGATKW
jgi:hypothetical protein